MFLNKKITFDCMYREDNKTLKQYQFYRKGGQTLEQVGFYREDGKILEWAGLYRIDNIFETSEVAARVLGVDIELGDVF